MAKAPIPRQSDSDLDSEKFARDRELDVLSQMERLRQELSEIRLSNERRKSEVRSAFTTEALGDVAEEITRVAHDESLPRQQRLEDLRRVQQLASKQAEMLEPRVPEKAPELWRNRNKRLNENPYQFARRVYAVCIDLITKNSIKRLDKSLYNRMLEFDKTCEKKNNPDYIPTLAEKREYAAQLITWSDVLAAVPPDARELLRAYQSQRYHFRTVKV